jgi:hypothetical protein
MKVASIAHIHLTIVIRVAFRDVDHLYSQLAGDFHQIERVLYHVTVAELLFK